MRLLDRRSWLGFLLVLVALPMPVAAQDAMGTAGDAIDEQMQTLSVLSNTIRWGGVLASVVLVVLSLFFLRFVDRVVDGLSETFTQRRLTLHKLRALLHFVVYLGAIAGSIVLSLRISNEVLAIVGGSLAVAVGFAMKDLVASLVSGVMIMIDQPFQVGDRVSFGGFYGDITSIGLRSVRLQTLDDNTVTIPNNMFLSNITSCGNYGELDMQVVVDFHIAPGQNTELARDLVREAAVSSRYVFLDKPVVVLVTEVIVDTHVAVRLRLKVYVLDTRYEKQLESDITLRVHRVFAQHGIGPPAVLHRSVSPPRGGGEPEAAPLSTDTGHVIVSE